MLKVWPNFCVYLNHILPLVCGWGQKSRFPRVSHVCLLTFLRPSCELTPNLFFSLDKLHENIVNHLNYQWNINDNWKNDKKKERKRKPGICYRILCGMFRPLDLSFEPPIISAADFFFYAYSNLISGLFLLCEEVVMWGCVNNKLLFFRFLWIVF